MSTPAATQPTSRINRRPTLAVIARQWLILGIASFVGCCLSAFAANCQAQEVDPPRLNVIIINADDLGFGDLGCYGQELIKTPRLDQMAREGMRFRNFYAGATVCAPSRCTMMTGRHNGHAWVRGNAEATYRFRPCETMTRRSRKWLAKRVTEPRCAENGAWVTKPRRRGGTTEATGIRLLLRLSQPSPRAQLLPRIPLAKRNQGAAPQRRGRNGAQGSRFRRGYATERIDYSHDLIMAEALNWVRQTADEPFLLVLTPTIPHANNEGTRGTGNGQEVPDYGAYADLDWKDQDKGQAAMITRLDAGVGELLDLLHELGIAERTLVLFTSDNGPHREGGQTVAMFNPMGPLRGTKRDLYEGGIRVPLIAWCPGVVPADTTTDHISYQGDFMATVGEIAGLEPVGADSISLWPTLTGHPADQQNHEFLYWEFYEQGGRQAVRFGDWKAIRQPMITGEIQLYNLAEDLGEANDIAADHPELVQRAREYLDQSHEPNPNWKPAGSPPPAPPAGDGRSRF
ncbi:MAG: arylsulfatase [Pirellulaceae bacterium]